MNTRGWSSQDFEDVVCCRCAIPGTLQYTADRFGIVACPRCGLMFTSPRLTKAAIGAIYENADYFDGGVYGFSKGLNGAMLLQTAWTHGRTRLIRRLLGHRANPTMLEIGCAYGLFLHYAQRQGFTVTGVEYSSTAVAWINEHLDLPVHRGELRDVDLGAGQFDVICFWDVVEHVDDPVEFLRLVRRLVKPSGLVIFSTPDVSSLAARLFRGRWWSLRPEQHLWHYTPRTLGLLCADAGLRLERTIRNPVAPSNAGRIDMQVGVARPGPA